MYDPFHAAIDYNKLTLNCVQELMRCQRKPLAEIIQTPFSGAGVYAIFYNGSSPLYTRLQDTEDLKEWYPIYDGKAIPKGGRKGRKRRKEEEANGRALWERLTDHHQSIIQTSSSSSSLCVDDFSCRYLVVHDLWIPVVERFLTETFQPVWNVCIDGFGNHGQGSGRHEQKQSWWDVLHPGRPWAARLRQTRTQEQAQTKLANFMRTYELKPRLTIESETPAMTAWKRLMG